MKTEIPLALPAAGMLLACLAASFNQPVVAHATAITFCDTVRYYNEQGVEIFCDTNAAKPGNFVIRTSKTHQELFPDWHGRNKKKSSGNYQPAAVNKISVKMADTVETLIKNGMVKDSLVKKNIVAILDKKTIRKMLDTIKDTGENANSTTDFCEYGGVIKKDSSITWKQGKKTDPRRSFNQGIFLALGALGNFHSHPSGEIREPINASQYNVFGFVQGPSLRDQRFIKNKKGYVFGMHKDFHVIYIYNNTGVLATLPFDYLLNE